MKIIISFLINDYRIN